MTVTAMEHVLVLSDDIEATREFYCDIVGLRVGERPPLSFGGYWLYAGEVPCLHIAERQSYLTHAAQLGLAISREPPGTGSVDHIAFNANDYDRVRRRLTVNGVRSVPNCVPGAGLRQLFFEDPNGVRVEINVRDHLS
jgi:catechol 2,3-dioxygenase-like lactoylglutathione lyase family enzyme